MLRLETRHCSHKCSKTYLLSALHCLVNSTNIFIPVDRGYRTKWWSLLCIVCHKCRYLSLQLLRCKTHASLFISCWCCHHILCSAPSCLPSFSHLHVHPLSTPPSSLGRRQESGENKMMLPKVFAPGKHPSPSPAWLSDSMTEQLPDFFTDCTLTPLTLCLCLHYSLSSLNSDYYFIVVLLLLTLPCTCVFTACPAWFFY